MSRILRIDEPAFIMLFPVVLKSKLRASVESALLHLNIIKIMCLFRNLQIFLSILTLIYMYITLAIL